MTEQERINQALQRQIDAQNARIDTVLAKVDMMIDEAKQQREDIRRAQEKHDADMREMNQRFYQKFDTVDAKFDKLSDQIHNLTIAAVVGFGAITAAVGGLVFAAFK
ncbi:MAG: hypothetical protein IJG32_09160 [Selenomonadaceae bacterium]|nr:hypothetical protein [Selenomonadaceae bacterium]